MENCDSQPQFWLAPLAGLNDLPFRLLCARFGALGCHWAPMICAQALMHPASRLQTLKLLEWLPEQERALQLFGPNPQIVGAALEVAWELGVREVNFNLGCQVPKVTKGGSGAILLRDLPQVYAILEAMKRSYPQLHLSLKLRLGWDNYALTPLLREAYNLGVERVFVHGRLGTDGFAGDLRWDLLARAAQESSVPFYANGGVTDWESAQRLLALPRCQGVMIGRGALGRADIFAYLQAKARGEELQDSTWSGSPAQRRQRQLELLKEHLELVERYGRGPERERMHKLRRHLAAYELLGPERLQVASFRALRDLIARSEQS